MGMKSGARNPFYCTHAESIVPANGVIQTGFVYVGSAGDGVVRVACGGSGVNSIHVSGCTAGQMVGDPMPLWVHRVYPSSSGTSASGLILMY